MTSTFETLPNTIVATADNDPGTFDMLRDSLRRVDGIIGLVLLSNEGFAKAAYGLETDDAQKIAAACSGMASLSASVSQSINGSDVLHTVVTMKARNVIVTSCGGGSTLLVVVRASAQIGLALGEIIRKAKAYAEQMGTLPRADLPAR
ncbi:roadblock/LC7 domain-containing protein [Streptomyces sp. NPDC007264]|uniref:roadblock/LC7 domain-containing protein n=1 Tax=Streptomyces sp. NPDC007264 TaxID=3364777 RepID=UPI0036DA5FF5